MTEARLGSAYDAVVKAVTALPRLAVSTWRRRRGSGATPAPRSTGASRAKRRSPAKTATKLATKPAAAKRASAKPKSAKPGSTKPAPKRRTSDKPSSSRRAPARTEPKRSLPPVKVVKLINEWGLLTGKAPDQDRSAAYLAGRTGVPRRQIDHARRMRNRCVHPGEHAPPTEAELDRALATLARVRAALPA